MLAGTNLTNGSDGPPEQRSVLDLVGSNLSIVCSPVEECQEACSVVHTGAIWDGLDSDGVPVVVSACTVRGQRPKERGLLAQSK